MVRTVIRTGIAVLVVCLGIVLLLPRPAMTDSASGQEEACASTPSPGAPSGLPAPPAPDQTRTGVPRITGKHPAFGVATEGGFGSPQQWDDVAGTVGESPALIMAYASFTEPVPLAGLEAVAARGAMPVLTWEPWDPSAGPDQTRFALSTIGDGHHDAYLWEWAAVLRSYGKPVLIRFAHEMNYPWYPWGSSAGAEDPAEYIRAWRHVHDVFDEAGASNVQWAWNPQAPTCDSGAFSPYYPGNDYVDVVALDGYNWGTSRKDERWRTPEELFGEGIRQARQLAPGKPIMIGETASAEAGGSKADWITGLIAFLAAHPDVSGFVWFDYQKEADWRIGSSRESREAFEAALSSR